MTPSDDCTCPPDAMRNCLTQMTVAQLISLFVGLADDQLNDDLLDEVLLCAINIALRAVTLICFRV